MYVALIASASALLTQKLVSFETILIAFLPYDIAREMLVTASHLVAVVHVLVLSDLLVRLGLLTVNQHSLSPACDQQLEPLLERARLQQHAQVRRGAGPWT